MYDHEISLYYLQSRYYDPEVGRFLNADAFVATGQGELGNNMFAYCRNNPVSRKDVAGTEDLEIYIDDGSDGDVDCSPLDPDDVCAGGWGTFRRALQDAADGLNMAIGQRDMSHKERHHVFSDKSKTYSHKFEEVADRYNYKLNQEENIVSLPGHRGRHTKAYHDLILLGINLLDYIADDDQAIFAEGIKVIVQFVEDNPLLPYAKYK